MERSLAEFFAAYERKLWRPGRVDCCLYLAAWAIWLGYPDPAQHLRGSYDSEDGYRAIIGASGGLTQLVGYCAAKIAAESSTFPKAGAIGVIGSAASIERQFGAIFDGDRWQVRFLDRIAPMTAKPLAIWII